MNVKKVMPLEHQALTEKIIGAAIEVHKKLGPGFLESIYENALLIELKKRGIKGDHQVEIPINYKWCRGWSASNRPLGREYNHSGIESSQEFRRRAFCSFTFILESIQPAA